MLDLSKATLPQVAIPKPMYDRSGVTPGVVHLGVGGFHRAHQAAYIDDLMQQGKAMEWGIVGVGLLPQDARMRDALVPQDCLYTLVTKDGGGEQARVIGSMIRYLFAPEQPDAVLQALTEPSTRIVTLTITEGGYALHDPHRPPVAFGYLARALRQRRDAGTAPFTVLSCDNVQQNGQISRAALVGFAERDDASLAPWISDNVAFPNSMVDRITPQTTEADRELVRSEFGIADNWPVVCEPFRQWVIEDNFSNGRPAFEDVGAQMVSDVHPYEKMKIRLLNAGHSALGYLGYLAGFRLIHDAAADPDFQELLKRMWQEVTPLLPPVPGIDLHSYQETLLARFANPQIKDQVARICLDGSAKMPRFVLPSLQEQLERGGTHKYLTLVAAAWMRYLSGTDDEGNKIVLEDPMAEQLQEAARSGGTDPRPLLQVRTVFGDLGDDAKLVGELGLCLRQLYEKGARAALRSSLS